MEKTDKKKLLEELEKKMKEEKKKGDRPKSIAQKKKDTVQVKHLNDEERKIKAEQLTDVVFKELEGLTTADAIPCLSYCILTLLNYVSQCSLVPTRELVLQFSKTLYEMQGTFLPRKPKMKVVNLKKRS